jgi:hypothetical protein
MQLVYLFKGLELSPAAVERIVSLVPPEAYDTKTDPERFTFREAMGHLADWEAINLDRLRQGLENPGCTVPGFDEGQIAIDRGYGGWDPVEQAKRFAAERAVLVDTLHSLNESEWEKVFHHSERGRQTIYEHAVTILGHDMYHIEHFTQYLP